MLTSFPSPFNVALMGAKGGIGQALHTALCTQGGTVHCFSRQALAGHHPIDLLDEASIAHAAQQCRAPLHLVIVATGYLHDAQHQPEKSLRQLDPSALAKSFAINAIGPALIAKHFTPLLAKQEKSVFAAFSARVGSVSDNRLGGWYGYRASKAALNMLIKTTAIEVARNRPQSIIVGLHPGTVATPLSAPFQDNVPSERLFQPTQAAQYLLKVIDQLTPANSGRCFAWDGQEISP